MIKRLHTAIRKYKLLLPGQHILVAVSGGADSVALLHILHNLASSLNIILTIVHVNHSLRGSSSDDDAVFVEELAKKLNVEFVMHKVNVVHKSQLKGISIEMAAREARYDFFARTAKKLNADLVATAHTADDQAETVLLKLARGAGPSGLAGINREIHIQGLKVIRPMLGENKADIISFLCKNKIEWREDASNNDTSFLRNRVRHEIIPILESRLNPKVKTAIQRTAEIIYEEDKWLDELASQKLSECLLSPERLNMIVLKNQPLPAIRRILRKWLISYGVSPKLIDFSIVMKLKLLLFSNKGTGKCNIGATWTVRREYDHLLIEPCLISGPVEKFKAEVKIPGETILIDQNLRIVTSQEPGIVKDRCIKPGNIPAKASLARSSIGRKKLFVRSWQSGDKIKPFGMKGSKKLQDIFVDTKVPANRRIHVPLFECGKEIIWLPGYRIARGWELETDKTKAVRIYIEPILKSGESEIV